MSDKLAALGGQFVAGRAAERRHPRPPLRGAGRKRDGWGSLGGGAARSSPPALAASVHLCFRLGASNFQVLLVVFLFLVATPPACYYYFYGPDLAGPSLMGAGRPGAVGPDGCV